METDCTMTWISGTEFCQKKEVQVYLNSLLECGFDGKKLVFTNDMPKDFRLDIEAKGFNVVDVPATEVEDINRDRHYAYYKYLSKHTDFRYVLITDSKDVLFQENPILFVGLAYGSQFIMLVDEGLLHKESWYNSESQKDLQSRLRAFKTDFNEWQVVNAGVMLGTVDKLKLLLLNTWMSTFALSSKCGDQAGLNFAYRLLTEDAFIFLNHPKDSVFCATGEGMNVGTYAPKPIWNNDKLTHADLKLPYCLFHQWDRTAYAADILRRYAKC